MSELPNELRRLAPLDHSHVLGDVMREAADEIERLRAIADRLRKLAIAFGTPMELLLDVDCPHCEANKAGGE